MTEADWDGWIDSHPQGAVRGPEVDAPVQDGSDAGAYLPDVLRTDTEDLSRL